MIKPAKLIFVTPFLMLLAHYLAVLPHEYAHSFMAWALGYKQNPFDIIYGGTSWQNLILLINIDENVNYDIIMAQKHLYHMALIAFAGPGIANGVLYCLSLYLLPKEKIQQKPYLYYFIFWFNFMNLANFYAYVPIRTFSPQGDIAHIAAGLTLSPWAIYIVAGYAVAFVFWNFFTHTLIRMFINLKIRTTQLKVALMMTAVIVLFGYFGMAGFLDNGDISHFLSATSFIMIPGIIITCWPTRVWIKRQLEVLRK
jgi:hypothetical protein